MTPGKSGGIEATSSQQLGQKEHTPGFSPSFQLMHCMKKIEVRNRMQQAPSNICQTNIEGQLHFSDEAIPLEIVIQD